MPRPFHQSFLQYTYVQSGICPSQLTRVVNTLYGYRPVRVKNHQKANAGRHLEVPRPACTNFKTNRRKHAERGRPIRNVKGSLRS